MTMTYWIRRWKEKNDGEWIQIEKTRQNTYHHHRDSSRKCTEWNQVNKYSAFFLNWCTNFRVHITAILWWRPFRSVLIYTDISVMIQWHAECRCRCGADYHIWISASGLLFLCFFRLFRNSHLIIIACVEYVPCTVQMLNRFIGIATLESIHTQFIHSMEFSTA